MPETAKAPGGATLFGLILLAGCVGATWWWLGRPAPDSAPPPLPDGDVYCSGRVDAAGPMVSLEPAVPGRVAEVLVQEGAAVAKGQELLRLEDATARARLAQAEAAVEAAKVEVASAEQEAARFPLQVAAREKLADAVAAQVAAAEASVRQRKEQATVTPLGPAEEAVYEAQVRGLRNQEAAERKAIDVLRQTDPRLLVRAAQARVRAAEADRAVARRAVDECVLKAPADGTVLRLGVAAGALLSPGSPFPPVVFAPAGPFVVRGEVDQEYLSKVRVGMSAECQDENRSDGPVVNGFVAEVAGWVAPKRSLLLEPGEATDVRTVEVKIALDPKAAAGLVIGQRMRVRLLKPAGG
jgi:multidrug resistance efflux pump